MSESVFDRPPIHPFVECPNCRQLLEYGVPHCPRCREEIEPEYALVSAVVVHHNTQAIAVAKTISSGDAFIPLALIGSILIYLGDWYIFGGPRGNFLLLFFWPSVPLLAIVVWYFRFGRFKIGDEEFLQARKELRRSFCFWLVFLVVQVLCVVVSLKLR